MPNKPNLEPWKLTHEEPALTTPRFTITKRIYRTPWNYDATFWIHSASDSVICFCLNEQNQVLIERQYRPAIGRVSVDFPAGKLEASDASPEAGMRRELAEELAFQPTELKLLGTIDKEPGWSESKLYVFLARGALNGTPKPDKTESLEIKSIPVESVLDLIGSSQMTCSFCLTTTLLAFRELKLPIS
jgi:8-oxo-dGTP pyrophosphatase MutT (NUDIX family)